MTREEELSWGEAERLARIADLSVRTREGLIVAQTNAETRRKAAGLSRGQAAALVIEANRNLRRSAAATEPTP
jgi:uncharacterized protein (DUF952 family)